MCTVQAPQSAMPQPNFVPVSCRWRSEEHTSELQSRSDLVCRLLLEKKKKTMRFTTERIADEYRVHTSLHPRYIGQLLIYHTAPYVIDATPRTADARRCRTDWTQQV